MVKFSRYLVAPDIIAYLCDKCFLRTLTRDEEQRAKHILDMGYAELPHDCYVALTEAHKVLQNSS